MGSWWDIDFHKNNEDEMTSKNTGVYITLTHKYIPKVDAFGKKTEQWEVIEEAEFIDRIKNRHYNNATVIIDVKNKKLLKNRVPDATVESFFDHIRKTYGAKFTKFLELAGIEDEASSKTEEESNEQESTTKTTESETEENRSDS